MSYSIYKTSQHKSTDTRDTEYRLLAQVTAAMLAAREKGSSSPDVREKVDAVLWNRDVWSALRTDLSSDGNNLPKDLRASLISVAIWIEKECMRVVDGTGDLNALIEVNRNIMSGLKPDNRSNEGEGEESPPEAGFESGTVSSSFATAI